MEVTRTARPGPRTGCSGNFGVALQAKRLLILRPRHCPIRDAMSVDAQRICQVLGQRGRPHLRDFESPQVLEIRVHTAYSVPLILPTYPRSALTPTVGIPKLKT